MGVNTYPCSDCHECFYSCWAYCESCSCRCDEWLDKLVCRSCFKDKKYDAHKLELCDEEFVLCKDCLDCFDGSFSDLYRDIKEAYQNHKYCKTSLDISLGNFELAVSEHNKFYNSKEQIRGRYLNEMLDWMEKIERDMRAVDIIAEKISKLHE